MKICGRDVPESLLDPVPEHTLDTLINYAEHGVPTGGFLYKMLACDLHCLDKADHLNQAAFVDIYRFMVNVLPGGCWGSYETVDAWLARKRKEREAAHAEKS